MSFTLVFNSDPDMGDNITVSGFVFRKQSDGVTFVADTSASSDLNYEFGMFFYDKLVSVQNIPNTVISIGDSAFSYCSLITEITIPDSVTSIADSVINSNGFFTSNGAFEGCTALTSVWTNSTSAWVYSHIDTDTIPAISNGVYNCNFYGLDLNDRNPPSLTVQVVTSTPPTPPPTPPPTVNHQTPSDNPICVLQ